MKRRLFQRIFARSDRDQSSNARRFSLEALENRELLNVDWGGFSSEILNEYSAESAAYSVDLSANSVDSCSLQDMNGDGVDELATINYSSNTLSIYQSDDAGAFSLVKTTKIANLKGDLYSAEAFVDVDADGIVDLVVVSQDVSTATITLNATVYKGDASFGFTRSSSTSLDVSKFSSGILFSSLDVATLPNASGGVDLVVQGEAVSASSSQNLRQTMLYSGIGTTNFGKSSKLVDTSGSAATTDPALAGSGTIDGNDYLISIDKTQKKNRLTLTSVGSSVSNYSLDLSVVASAFTAEWVLEENGVLVVGGSRGGMLNDTGVLSIKVTSAVDGTFEYSWVQCDDINIDSSSCAAIGNLGGSKTTPELFIVNNRSYVVFEGTASDDFGYEFERVESVVTNPLYRDIRVDDFDGDGAKEALLIGEKNVWVADVAEDGTTGPVRSIRAFGRSVKDVVFGDFDGDGLLDFAVYYQAEGSDITVGTNVQLFKRTNGGELTADSFVPFATYGLKNVFVDFAAGSFTQGGKRDEIAVLSRTAAGETSVEVLTLDVSSGAAKLSANSQFSYKAASVEASALTVGTIFGNAVDDIALVCTNQDSLVVLKNEGTAFSATTYSTNTGLNVTNFAPTAAAIGDVDGDGKNDIVVLNSASGANRGHLAYFRQTSSGGFSSATSDSSLYINGDAPQGLKLVDLNGDSRLDALTIQKTTAGEKYLYYFLNDGTSSIFADGVRSTKSTVDVSSGEILIAKINGDSSYDVALTQGLFFGFYLNVAEGPTQTGSVQFLCQSASSAAGDSFEAASETARTWIDEWSNFYMDVWASADGSVALTSATAALQYNPNYFTLSRVEAAAGFSVEQTSANGVVTVSATANGGTNAVGKTLVARIRFEPITKGSYVVGGVDIPENGVLTSVDSGFGAAVASQKINGSTAASTDAPDDIALYPVDWDFNDDGKVNAVDFNSYLVYFDVETNNIPAADVQYAIFDSNVDGKINAIDFNNFISYFDVQATKTADTFYREEPKTIIAMESAPNEIGESSVLLDDGEYSLVNPSERLAENRRVENDAVDVVLNSWSIEEIEEIANPIAAAVSSVVDVEKAESVFATFDADDSDADSDDEDSFGLDADWVGLL